MIQALELRIGNYVMYGSEYRKISGVDDNDERGSYVRFLGLHYGVWIEEVQHIPLTEDILIKCGFTKVPLDSNNPEEGYYYEWDVTEGFFLLSGDNDDVFMCENDKVRFKYLHQLQNIYRALTGKEMEVNL